jgi:hypothetical protein
MRVFVNGTGIDLLPGMTVRHALIGAGFPLPFERLRVRDAWGNEVGLDGALTEGDTLTVEPLGPVP